MHYYKHVLSGDLIAGLEKKFWSNYAGDRSKGAQRANSKPPAILAILGKTHNEWQFAYYLENIRKGRRRYRLWHWWCVMIAIVVFKAQFIIIDLWKSIKEPASQPGRPGFLSIRRMPPRGGKCLSIQECMLFGIYSHHFIAGPRESSAYTHYL